MDVQFVDTTFRDGSQSLWAMGMRTGMMAAVAPDLDRAGFQAIETPANSTFFKKFIRDLKEDPWDMLRAVARGLPNTVKTSMGGFVRAFELPQQWAVRLFYECIARTGALDQVQLTANTTDQATRSYPWMIPMLRDLGYKVVCGLSYTISPRHTDEYYGARVRQVLRFRPDAVYLKDQGGLLTPDRARTLIPTLLANAAQVPLELHSHCTTGLAPLVYLEAVEMGIRTLHTAIPPLANGSSQPSIFNVARNLRLMGHSPRIDTRVLKPAADRLTAIAQQEGLPMGAPLEYDHGQFVHQVPGGVISVLRYQLAELGLADRLDEVLEEVVQVRRELGYPIMITPYSQFMVTQAAINVSVGQRFKVVLDEVIRLAQGAYGEDSGNTWMDANVKDIILGRPRAAELARLAEAPQSSLREVREQLGGPDLSDEEFMLRYMMKGDREIAAMRAAGPPRSYSAMTPLQALFAALNRYERARYIHVQKGGSSVVLRRSVGK